MTILSIETSCDETAVSIIEARGEFPNATYTVLGDALFSQVETHREYGGVFPALAKREHAATLVPMLEKALVDAKLEKLPHSSLFPEQKEQVRTLLEREPGLADNLLTFFEDFNTPAIDCISVTSGPGLEPALWVGVNFAKALSYVWNVPIIPVDHMEGHILSSLFDGEKIAPISFPALALLISGGHTELVLMKDWGSYEVIGNTLDDAVGEAFDKVARMLGLPYPGGPEISRLAGEARKAGIIPSTNLPRPMKNSGDLNMSFSGLKTAVLYTLQAIENKEVLSEEKKKEVALDFEEAVTEVLIAKTETAIDTHGIETIILGGGVSANSYIRDSFSDLVKEIHPHISLYLPDRKLTTDNAVMIALSGHARAHEALRSTDAEGIRALRADGTRSLSGG